MGQKYLKNQTKGHMSCKLDLALYMFQILWVKVLSFKSYVWIFPKMFNIQLPYIVWSSPIES